MARTVRIAGESGFLAISGKTSSTFEPPRLGFLGLGWIGQLRLKALLESGAARVLALLDPNPNALEAARRLAPEARVASTFEDLWSEPLDGLVIATPSALHAQQSQCALERGLAVFCQNPLGRNAIEVHRVLEAAKASDRLLGVDFSYRTMTAMQRVRQLAQSGELGSIYAVELVFHNAHGPNKPWFYDAQLSGGGALMDLGSHLVDLALWVLDFPKLSGVASQLYVQGSPLLAAGRKAGAAEDFASGQLAFEDGVAAHLSCSWKLHAGADCVIEASFYGSRGAVSLRNVRGSFYDFTAEAFFGTSRRVLSTPPDAWGGRALVAWAEHLARSRRYDPAAEELLDVARVLDSIYSADPPAFNQEE